MKTNFAFLFLTLSLSLSQTVFASSFSGDLELSRFERRQEAPVTQGVTKPESKDAERCTQIACCEHSQESATTSAKI